MPIDASKIKWDTPDQPNPKGIVWDKTPNLGNEEIKPIGWKQRVEPYVRPVFEYGGAAIGSALALPAAAALSWTGVGGPALEAGGGALGYEIGRYGSDLLFGSGQLPNTKEAAIHVVKQIPSAITVGMAGPVGGKVVGAIGDRLSTWGLGKTALTEDMLHRKAIASEAGVTLSPADITGKRSHAIIEDELRRNVGSADIVQKFDMQKIRDAERYAAKIQEERFGSPMDRESAGQIAQETSRARYRKFQGNASELYNRIPVDPETPVPTSNLRESAGEEFDVLGKINNGAIKRILSVAQQSEQEIPSKILDAKGNPLPGTVKPTYDWQQLITDQSTLRKLARTTSDPNLRRIYRNLIGAINDDIGEFAERNTNPAIKETLDKAVQYYRNGDSKLPGVQVWRDRQIKNMINTNSPEDIVNKFLKAFPNTSDIQRLKAAAGPKGFQAIKRAWLSDMLTRGEGGSFSPARFVTLYDRYRSGGNLDVILAPRERVGLNKLYEISKIINTAERLAGNPSGTAQMNINDLYRWILHPIRETLLQLGNKTFAAKYFDDPVFRANLLKLTTTAPGTAASMAAHAALIGSIRAYQQPAITETHQYPEQAIGQ